MANPILAFPNRADAATITGGGWRAELPLANLQDRRLSHVARSSSASVNDTKFDVDLGAPRGIRIFALIGINITDVATYRLRGSRNAGFTDVVFDSGAAGTNVWPVVYSSDSLDWEDDNWWTGRYAAEEIAGYTWTLLHVLPVTTVARYWRLEVFDPTNAAGYVQAGRLFLAGQWQPDRGMAFGAQLALEDRTQIEQAEGGAEYFDVRPISRIFRFRLQALRRDDAHSRAFEIMRQAGTHRDVFLVIDPDDTTQRIRRSFLGRLRELSPLEYELPQHDSLGFEVKEVIG
ncbi:hypothetical protein HB662_01195 [Roseomonas frigidaquae]|uniref:Discoidin domain-containing protein n=1 Tax=Falsiroseomonas frigidaquae TaxID=487318 RepID=A0ABX1ERW8_9PROT|nr:hypothetical protein [Falsiroseomonas frigidaquae]NKE43375.1 hypothetical protein [Falsiroseomonas frigidaquae]